MQKDPYTFSLPSLKEKYVEKDVEKALVEKIKDTMLALGTGFSFIANQYKITVDDKDYFIDLLFYNIKLNCYFIIELKTREFEPAHAGQLNFYLSAIDKYLKTENQNPSIGILMVKSKSRLSVELALQDVNKPIGVSSFEILKVIPKEVLEALPTEEDINLYIDIEED